MVDVNPNYYVLVEGHTKKEIKVDNIIGSFKVFRVLANPNLLDREGEGVV